MWLQKSSNLSHSSKFSVLPVPPGKEVHGVFIHLLDSAFWGTQGSIKHRSIFWNKGTNWTTSRCLKTILAQVKVLIPCIPPRLYSRKRKVHRREVVRKTLWNFLLTCDKFYILESLVAQRLKHLPLIREIWVRSLENPMDGGAWWATVHGVTKSRTWLSDLT